MLQPFNPVENILLIHRISIQEELQRNDPEGHRAFHDVPSSRNMLRLRQLVGRALVAAGHWLAPAGDGRSTAPAATDRAM